MKFFNYETADAFEQPSILGWLVVFVCGFLTVCIICPVLYLLAWLFVTAMQWLQMSSPPAWEVSVASISSIVFKVATVFGTLLATVMVLGLARRRQQEARIQGHHHLIGNFAHSPFYKTWHAQPVLPTGQSVRLSAYGSGPSAAQSMLWQQFIANYHELIAAATQSLLAAPHPLKSCETVTLSPCGITMPPDGTLHLGFEFATVPEGDWDAAPEAPYPTASFTAALELKNTEWLQPFG